MTPLNMFMPMIAKMKNINKIRLPTLAIEGKITTRLSSSTLSFFESLISLSTLKMRTTLKIMEMVAMMPFWSIMKRSMSKAKSAQATIKKSSLFQLDKKYSDCSARSLSRTSRL